MSALLVRITALPDPIQTTNTTTVVLRLDSSIYSLSRAIEYIDWAVQEQQDLSLVLHGGNEFLLQLAPTVLPDGTIRPSKIRSVSVVEDADYGAEVD